jgi:hypothetical protein
MGTMDYTNQLRLFEQTWHAFQGKQPATTTAPVVIDLEKVDYINQTTKITQIGLRVLSSVDHSDQPQLFLVSENLRYKNRFCVVNHQNFAFGASSTISRQRDVNAALNLVLGGLAMNHNCVVLIGWDIASDMRWLQSGLGWVPPSEKYQVLDLQAVYMSIHGIPRGRKPSLKSSLRESGIDFLPEHLHNAGNDAFYTGELFLILGNIMYVLQIHECRLLL